MQGSETKFTPGPWHNQSKNYGYTSCYVCGPKHADGGDYAPICIANTEANAHLIAASPTLYEALTVINRYRGTQNGMADLFHVVVREEGGKYICIGDVIDAALAKAVPHA